MRSGIFLALAQFRPFWKIRERMQGITFRLHRRVFLLGHSLTEESVNLSYFRNLLRLVQLQLIFAVSFGLILQFIDPHLDYVYRFLGLSVPGDGGYISLLATVGGMGGFFIGL